MSDLKEHLRQLKIESQSRGNKPDDANSDSQCPTGGNTTSNNEINGHNRLNQLNASTDPADVASNKDGNPIPPPQVDDVNMDHDGQPQVSVNNCSICLQPLTSRSVLEPCCHEFDYECIKEWIDLHNHCPYCRIPTTAIIHNIQSDTMFDTVAVEPRAHRHGEDEDEYFDSDSDLEGQADLDLILDSDDEVMLHGDVVDLEDGDSDLEEGDNPVITIGSSDSDSDGTDWETDSVDDDDWSDDSSEWTTVSDDSDESEE